MQSPRRSSWPIRRIPGLPAWLAHTPLALRVLFSDDLDIDGALRHCLGTALSSICCLVPGLEPRWLGSCVDGCPVAGEWCVLTVRRSGGSTLLRRALPRRSVRRTGRRHRSHHPFIDSDEPATEGCWGPADILLPAGEYWRGSFFPRARLWFGSGTADILLPAGEYPRGRGRPHTSLVPPLKAIDHLGRP